jgi:hypothetical protein
VYRARNVLQERRGKRMIDQGALDINYDRQTIIGPDRQQQRKQARLAQALETAHKRVDKKAEAVKAQQDKGIESETKGHGKRLAAPKHRRALGPSAQGGQSDTCQTL